MQATAKAPRQSSAAPAGQEDYFPADVSWLAHLPDSSITEFLAEFASLTRAKDWLGLSQMLAEWKGVAEIHADPKLYKELTRKIKVKNLDSIPRP
jgi:hypothetical protein